MLVKDVNLDIGRKDLNKFQQMSAHYSKPLARLESVTLVLKEKMKKNNISFWNIFALTFYVLAGVSVVLLALGDWSMVGVWLIVLQGLPWSILWSILPIESDLSYPFSMIHPLGALCINLIIVSVVCWKNGHKHKNNFNK